MGWTVRLKIRGEEKAKITSAKSFFQGNSAEQTEMRQGWKAERTPSLGVSVNLANIMRHSLLDSLWLRDPASLGIWSQGSSGGTETLNPPSKHLKPKMNWIMEAITKSPTNSTSDKINDTSPLAEWKFGIWAEKQRSYNFRDNAKALLGERLPLWLNNAIPWETSIYQMKQLKKIETWINLSLLKKMNS